MIRKMQKTDIKSVMKIWLRGNTEAHPFIPKEYWESNFEMVQNQILQAEVYVYDDGEDIQGFIGLQEDYIAGIFVKRERRGGGIGKQMLDFAKINHSVLRLNVYRKNYRAAEFYKREGFLEISEDMDPDTGEANVTMCWNRRADSCL